MINLVSITSTPCYFITMVMQRRRTRLFRYVLSYICLNRIRATLQVDMQRTPCPNSMSFERRVFKLQHSLRGFASATNVKLSLSARLEICVIIKFCHNKGKTPTQTLTMIKQTKKESLVSRALVFKWHRRFADGQDSLEEQEGRAGKKETV